LLNATVLLISLGAILYEAVNRFFHPEPVPGITIALVAGVGIVINTVSALMFLRNKDKDLNIKSAYLHLMSDAVVSLALVIGGIIIHYTQWYWLDTLLSVGVVIAILFSTWGLLRNSLRLSLDGVPGNIDLDATRALALGIDGVKDFYHIHIWAISTSENALTGHLVLASTVSPEQEIKIKSELKHALLHQQIHHVTLETQREGAGAVEAFDSMI